MYVQNTQETRFVTSARNTRCRVPGVSVKGMTTRHQASTSAFHSVKLDVGLLCSEGIAQLLAELVERKRAFLHHHIDPR